MNKYAEVTTSTGAGLFSVKDIVSCYLDGSNDILMDYASGSKIVINGSSALVQADVDIVFDSIKQAQQENWKKVKVVIPSLSQTVTALVFTF
tara:strand:- start:5176 stop:5451 length:276 start_codon:yes stop_codon:yes gene_type:complete